MHNNKSLLIRKPEAARLLGISTQQLRKLIAAGQLETVRLTPNGWTRVRRADVEALACGRRRARGEP
jgi:excisionase family DNA binding protein